MEAPNRRGEVGAIIEPFLPFPPGENNDPYRLQLLLEHIIPGLNKLDEGKWGYLTKTDQSNKIPCDILVWKDTNETIDCLTGISVFWDNQGPNTNPAWIWTAVSSDTPIPVPEPIPPVNDGPSNQDIMNAITDLKAEVLAVHKRLDEVVENAKTSLTPVVQKIMSL